MYRFIVLILTSILSTQSSAELYKWVDENGKVHFSDKKYQAPKNAQDISASLKATNVDTSRKSQQQLSEVFAQRQSAQQRNQANPQRQKAAREARNEQCQKMRNKLDKIDGPVQYVDHLGNMIPVTEKQRQQDEAKTRNWINKNC